MHMHMHMTCTCSGPTSAQALLGQSPKNASSLEHINQSGAGYKKKAVRKLIENDPGVMEAVCTIYAQDFVCLGYPIPPICQRFGVVRHPGARAG